MQILAKPKIVLLGMMSHMPVAGNVWLVAQYLVGFQRLGYDVYYVEAHGLNASMLMRPQDRDSSDLAAAFIARVLTRFDLGDRWAYHAPHGDGRCLGMTESQLKNLYQSAALIINLHGGTMPLPEHYATDRLVYLGTDPVQVEVELYHDDQRAVDFLAPHCAFFTWGENYGNADCGVPVSRRFHFRPTRAPVILDFWQSALPPGDVFTTIGNWRQHQRDITFQGEVYRWSKHHEFLKFLDLPARTDQRFELALSGGSFDEADQRMLEANGWRVRDALSFSTDLDAYRHYLAQSRGEFTVAKDQNVRLRSGWFSERSAQYLAAGRPVITQETGFRNILPTGAGLFGFTTLPEVLNALDCVNAAYEHHCRAALHLAREYFSYDVVLTHMLAELGLGTVGNHQGLGPVPRGDHDDPVPTSRPLIPTLDRNPERNQPFSDSLVLTPVMRWPTTLPEGTVRSVLANPIPSGSGAALDQSGGRQCTPVSIVIVTCNNLVFTRLCLETLLANTAYPNYEVIVVDNGSSDNTVSYLRSLVHSHAHLRAVFNERNLGFAAGNNEGLALATGEVLVLLNNDTLLPNGWLTRLVGHLEDESIGLVGPVTNRTGNEAQIEVPYHNYGTFLQFAKAHVEDHAGKTFDIRMLGMFCVALRHSVYRQVGPLDERFEIGLFEDDDYALRVCAAGYRVVCAEDVFVHHFGQASLGHLGRTGEYGRLFALNRQRWEEKWLVTWQPYQRRPSMHYQQLTRRLRQLVQTAIPVNATLIVVSKGDDNLLDLGTQRAWHFPRAADGHYAGHYPADSTQAIAHLEALREEGAEFFLLPHTAFWWLEHYQDFARHLHSRYRVVLHQETTCLIFALDGARFSEPHNPWQGQGTRAIVQS